MHKLYLVDSEDNIAHFASFFTRRSCIIFQSSTIEEALKEIESMLPHMLVVNLDILGSKTSKLLRALKSDAHTRRIPFIVSTKVKKNPLVRDMLNKGANDFIILPATDAAFEELYTNYMGQKHRTLADVLRTGGEYSSAEHFSADLLPLLSEHFSIEKMAILILDNKMQSMKPLAWVNISPMTIKKSKFAYRKSLVRTIKKFSKPIRTNKLFSDLRFMDISFDEKEKLLQMETDLIIPLRVVDQFRGILAVGKRRGKPLTSREISELTTICGKVMSILEMLQGAAKKKSTTDDISEQMATASLTEINKVDYSVPLTSGPIYTKKVPEASLEFQAGDIFADRFTILEPLGKGSIGVVYRVLDTQLDEEVAIKIIYPELAKNKKEKNRLIQKISKARKVSQRNIVSYYDFEEFSNYSYISMAFVRGKSLLQMVREARQLSVKTALPLIYQICDALTAIHEAGLIHGNLKANNVRIDNHGKVKILDMVIGRPFDVEDDISTDIIYETAEYISPEQASGDNVDHRTDIYSLGVLLYLMFTGTVPFASETPVSTALLHVESPPMTPRKFNTYLPFTLESVIMKCLAKTPRARFQSVYTLRQSLDQLEIEESEGAFSEEFVAIRKEDQISQFIEQGEKYFVLGQYLDCIAEMKKVLSIMPQHVRATEMIEEASRKLEIDPSGAISPHILELPLERIIDKGRELLRQGDAQACIDTIRSALKKDPDNSQALELLSTAQKKLLEDEVKKRREMLKEQVKEIKRLYKEGKRLFKSAAYEQCIELMNQILEIDAFYSAAQKLKHKAEKKLE